MSELSHLSRERLAAAVALRVGALPAAPASSTYLREPGVPRVRIEPYPKRRRAERPLTPVIPGSAVASVAGEPSYADFFLPTSAGVARPSTAATSLAGRTRAS